MWKPKLIMLQGLPGSGKSTEAKKLVKEDEFTVRLSRDCLREMFYFLKKNQWRSEEIGFRKSIEPDLVQAQFMLARYLLRHGYTVIIDDTNFDKKRINKYKKLTQSEEVEFELRVIDTSMEECIKRDLGRDDKVGEEVIRIIADQARREQ